MSIEDATVTSSRGPQYTFTLKDINAKLEAWATGWRLCLEADNDGTLTQAWVEAPSRPDPEADTCP